MTKVIGSTSNTTDETTGLAGVALNTLTWTKTHNANPKRLLWRAANFAPNIVVCREAPASAPDSGERPIPLPKNSVYESQPDNVYTGEISAKSLTGTPTIYPSEL